MTPEVFLLGTVPPLALAGARWATRRSAADGRGVLLELLPPDGVAVSLQSWHDFFQALYAIARPRWKRWLIGQPWLTFEFWAEDGIVRVRCWMPERVERLVRTQLLPAVPGLAVREADSVRELPPVAGRARLRLDRDPLYPLGDPRPEPLAGVINALSSTSRGVFQLALQPDVGWQSEACRRLDVLAGIRPAPLNLASLLSGGIDFLFDLVLARPSKHQPARTKPAHSHPMPPLSKASQPGYRAELRLRAAGSTSAEARASVHSLMAAFRSFDGANGLRPKRVWLGARFDRSLLSRRAPSAGRDVLVPDELAALFHLPVATEALEVAPVRLAPPRVSSSAGKVLCLSEGATPAPILIAQADCRQHIHICGPTGSGKSTLILNLALDDILAGRGIAVVDPKGDLVRDLLERIPECEWDRVVLIDPALRDRPVGLNVLDCADEDLREVVADQLVTIFRKNYERFWGPRTDDILRAAVLTLLHNPGSTLCEVPLLLLRPEARQGYTVGLGDPVGLGPFWDEYEQMPEGTRLQMVGPVLNKLRSVLLRRTVRNMLGQPESTVSLAEAVDRRQIVLVSLSKGLLGEDTSRLLGAFFVARLWQAVLARAAQPEAERADFNLYLDEFQNYLHLPQSLDEVLVEARGYHLGLVLANQHLGQLSSSTREALSANARTRVFFQCGQEDARYLAREFEPHLSERHLRNLQRFQVAARLCVDGRTQPPCTGITRPSPPSLGAASRSRLIETSLSWCGRPRQVVEAALERRLEAFQQGPVESAE
jgi:hypothetical protein